MSGHDFPRGTPEHEAWCRQVDPEYDQACREAEARKAAPAVATPAAPAARPAADENRPVKFKTMRHLLGVVAGVIRENNVAFDERIKELQERLATAEFRLAGVMGLISEFAPNQKLQDVSSFARQIGQLQKKIGALESKNLEYRGIWDAKESYPAGSFVTHAGSVWHAAIATQAVRPGDGNCWRLAVKRGADGKGAR